MILFIHFLLEPNSIFLTGAGSFFLCLADGLAPRPSDPRCETTPTHSAHPFENPTPLSNFLEMLAILLIPAALCYTFGKMVGDARQGHALLIAMVILLVSSVAAVYAAEMYGNPLLGSAGVDMAG